MEVITKALADRLQLEAAKLHPASHDECLSIESCRFGDPLRCPHHEMHGNQWGLHCEAPGCNLEARR